MKRNEAIRRQILLVVDNQIRDNNPPESLQTYNRLSQAGISDDDGRIYIGQCVSVEMFHAIKHKQPFDEKRYIKNLLALPNEPFE